MKSSATAAFLGNKLHYKSARELQKPRDSDILVQLQVSYYNVSEHICLQDKNQEFSYPLQCLTCHRKTIVKNCTKFVTFPLA